MVILNAHTYIYILVSTYGQPVTTQLTSTESCNKPSNNDAASEDGLMGRNM
jgi:hypothetical protein